MAKKYLSKQNKGLLTLLSLLLIGISLALIYISTQAVQTRLSLTPKASGLPKYTCSTGTWKPLSAWTGMNGPVGLAVDPYDNVWVVSDGDHKLRKFSNYGDPLLNISLGTSQIWGIKSDSLGNVYVSLRTDRKVYRYNNSGSKTGEITTGPSLTQPMGLSAFKDRLYVIDAAGPTVVRVYNLETLAYISTLSSTNFDAALDIVAHTPLARGELGDEILVARSFNLSGYIRRFDINGNFQNQFANHDDNFLTLDSADNIYISDGFGNGGNGQVRKYSPSGTLIESLAIGANTVPRGIALSNDGTRLYVSARNSDSIKRYSCAAPQ